MQASVEQILALAPDEAAEALAALPETQWFERKSGRIKARDLAVALSALANSEGGYVIVGLHDSAVDPVDASHENALRQAGMDFTVPPVRTRITALDTTAGRILGFRVEPGNEVHENAKGDVYLRIGDESRRLTFAQRRQLQFDRGSAPFDGTRVDASPADLDSEQLQEYQQLLGTADAQGTLNARDLLTRNGDLTVAAWLLFAKRPQVLFPSATIRVLGYAENDRGTGASMTLLDGRDVRFDGSIPRQIADATATIEDWAPKVRALSPNGRFEPQSMVPRDAWLEGLVNAVLHRSYSMAGDHVRFEIFPNRMEIHSPGRFPGLADPANPMAIPRYARNPRIVRVCSDLGIARELGEGIQRMHRLMRDRGLVDPLYEQTASSVRLVLSHARRIPDETQAALPTGAIRLLDALQLESRPMSTGQITELSGLARTTVIRHLNALKEHGLVEWTGDSPKDPHARWSLR